MNGQDNPLIPNPHPHLLNSKIKKSIIIPSSYQPKKTHKPREAIRTTEISQSSGPINLVADDTIHKELGDRMERVATTASSLEAEQDSGSGLRCQDTILGGADAQTRFKTASKQSNNLSLSRGYTLRSGEDVTTVGLLTTIRHNIVLSVYVNAARLNLVLPVQVNAAEGDTINASIQEDACGTDCLPTATIFEELARMGPQKKQSRRKQRKETKVSQDETQHDDNVPTPSNDPPLSGKGCSSKGDCWFKEEGLEFGKEKEIKNYRGRSDDAEMFDTNVLFCNEVFDDMIEKDQDVIPKEVSTAAPSTTSMPSPSPVITDVKITLAQTLAKLKSAKSKGVIQEPIQSTATTTPSTIPKAKGITFRDAGETTIREPTLVSSSSIKDKWKGKMDKLEVPLKKNDQIALDEEMARNLEA
ncbi:hypothetical protein Tco_0016840 [Tanacetum coccineum]